MAYCNYCNRELIREKVEIKGIFTDCVTLKCKGFCVCGKQYEWEEEFIYNNCSNLTEKKEDEMTIEKFYKWAKENGYTNYKLMVTYENETLELQQHEITIDDFYKEITL